MLFFIPIRCTGESETQAKQSIILLSEKHTFVANKFVRFFFVLERKVEQTVRGGGGGGETHNTTMWERKGRNVCGASNRQMHTEERCNGVH